MACALGTALAVLAVECGALAADPAYFPAAPLRSDDAPLGTAHADTPRAPASASALVPLAESAPLAEPRLVEPHVETVVPRAAVRLAPGPALADPGVTLSSKGPTRILGLSLPAFIALGAGGISAGGALLTHMAASSPSYSDPKQSCAGPCSDNPQTLALASKLLGAFAAAAISTGLVLAVTDSGPKKADFKPSLRLNLSPKKAAASALWTF